MSKVKIKKNLVKPSTNAELNAKVGIKEKVNFAKENWVALKFNEEFGDLTQQNVSKCIGHSIGSVAIYWKGEADKPATTTTNKPKAKTNTVAVIKNTSILDEEPVRNKIVSYTTENSTKSLKELYFELGEAHGELEVAEAKIETIETQIQEKRFASKN